MVLKLCHMGGDVSSRPTEIAFQAHPTRDCLVPERFNVRRPRIDRDLLCKQAIAVPSNGVDSQAVCRRLLKRNKSIDEESKCFHDSSCSSYSPLEKVFGGLHAWR